MEDVGGVNVSVTLALCSGMMFPEIISEFLIVLMVKIVTMLVLMTVTAIEYGFSGAFAGLFAIFEASSTASIYYSTPAVVTCGAGMVAE
jgi:hypothetical protein